MKKKLLFLNLHSIRENSFSKREGFEKSNGFLIYEFKKNKYIFKKSLTFPIKEIFNVEYNCFLNRTILKIKRNNKIKIYLFCHPNFEPIRVILKQISFVNNQQFISNNQNFYNVVLFLNVKFLNRYFSSFDNF